MEVNQNPEHLTDNPVKREESGSPCTTNDKQVSVHDFMIKRLRNEAKDTRTSLEGPRVSILFEIKSEKKETKTLPGFVFMEFSGVKTTKV